MILIAAPNFLLQIFDALKDVHKASIRAIIAVIFDNLMQQTLDFLVVAVLFLFSF